MNNEPTLLPLTKHSLRRVAIRRANAAAARRLAKRDRSTDSNKGGQEAVVSQNKTILF